MKYVLPSVFLFFLSACNLNQNVAIRGVDLHAHEDSGDTYIDLESIVSLGNLKLPDTNFPIKNSDQLEIGEVSIQHLDDGTSRVAVSVNYDEASKMNSEPGKTLPNGREIPAMLGNTTPSIGIPILDHSRIYVGGTKESFFAGIALNIPAFDHILTQVTTPLNLFLPFPFSEEVLGVAGLYTGPHPTQNGLAIFAKKSQPSKNTLLTDAKPVPTEIEKVDRITLIRLNYLFNKHAIVRIK